MKVKYKKRTLKAYRHKKRYRLTRSRTQKLARINRQWKGRRF